jgi:hypothetical protein
MKYVFITKGVVTDIAQIDPFTVFHAEYAKHFIPAPDEVTHWWTYDGTTFTAPVVVEPTPVPAPTKEELLAQLNALAAQIQALE